MAILEVGPKTTELQSIFSTQEFLNLGEDSVNQLPNYLKTNGGLSVNAVFINTGPFNGGTSDLIKKIRTVYTGVLIVIVSIADCKDTKKYLEAGADDALFERNVNINTINEILTRYNLKLKLKEAINDLKLATPALPLKP